MLPDASSLIARSAAQHPLPDLQLRALLAVALGVTSPPMDLAQAAELIAANIRSATQAALARSEELLTSPDTLAALFELMAGAARAPPGGPCQDRLRPVLFAEPGAARAPPG